MPINLSTDNNTILPTLSNAVESSGSSWLLVSETRKLVSTSLRPKGSTSSRAAATAVELQLLFPLVRVNFELGVIMVIAVSCVASWLGAGGGAAQSILHHIFFICYIFTCSVDN